MVHQPVRVIRPLGWERVRDYRRRAVVESSVGSLRVFAGDIACCVVDESVLSDDVLWGLLCGLLLWRLQAIVGRYFSVAVVRDGVLPP